MARRGKIARLPEVIREELNRRLKDGEQGKTLLVWLNGLPQTVELVTRDFGGVPVSKQNLCEWRAGGFREWLARQELFGKEPHELAAESEDIAATTGGQLTDHLATILAARYAVAIAGWDGPATDELRREVRLLRGLCVEVTTLRRGDHRREGRELRKDEGRMQKDEGNPAVKSESAACEHGPVKASQTKNGESLHGCMVTLENAGGGLWKAFSLSMNRNEAKAPNSKHQAPEKLQISNRLATNLFIACFAPLRFESVLRARTHPLTPPRRGARIKRTGLINVSPRTNRSPWFMASRCIRLWTRECTWGARRFLRAGCRSSEGLADSAVRAPSPRQAGGRAPPKYFQTKPA